MADLRVRPLALALTFAVVPAIGPAAAQNAQASNTGAAGEIRGTVVDSATGRPVGRALVTSTDRRLATLTDSSGHFTLTLAPPDSVTPLNSAASVGGPQILSSVALTAQRPGYIPPEYPVIVSLEKSPAEVQLDLIPAGRVTGTILTETNAPARGVIVLLLKRSVQDGERRWIVLRGGESSSDGSFQFGDLDAGEYTVETGEWAGSEPLPAARNRITRQYPPEFFGGVGTLAGATVFQLQAGETMRSQLQLRPATYYPVSLPIRGGARHVGVQVLGPGFQRSSFEYNRETNTLEGALPDGEYSLLLTAFQGEAAFAGVSLHVDGGPLHVAPTPLVSPAPIAVQVRTQWTGAPPDHPPTVGLRLRSSEDGLPFVGGSTTPEQPDSLQLSGAAPGDYTVSATATYGYIASIRCGSADLAKEKLVVGSAGVTCPIEVTLRDDGGSISGAAEGAGALRTSQQIVFLLPPLLGDQFLAAGVGQDGRFTFGNVPPGNYRIFAASPFPAEFAWRDPAAVDRISSKGVAVTITPKGSTEVNVPLLDSAIFKTAAAEEH